MPIVPAAVIYDLAEGDPEARPDAAAGEAACEAAAEGVPERGAVGAGTGAAVGKLGGGERDAGGGRLRERPAPAAASLVAALAVVNAFGDVIGADGAMLAGSATGPSRARARLGSRRSSASRTGARSRSATRRSSA